MANAEHPMDIRHRVMSMESEDCRQELADTLVALNELRSDFRLLCKELVLLTRADDVSIEFGEMVERLQINFD